MKNTGFHEDLTPKFEVTRSSDRSFGLVFCAFWLLLGAAPVLSGSRPRIWALILSGLFLVGALVRPSVFRPLNSVWTGLGLLLGKLVTPVAASILFYTVFTPLAGLLRARRKDLLSLRFEKNPSYWLERRPAGPAGESMSRQF
jgi:hypothetical protein